ncbi:hypothetical protein CBR_g6643 [Chara braunii]|uniref:Myb/SANT-like DNA-binding domain-containing protein n=1 Tax=Chara braunii TaxID=69332 RepID=A0A388KKC6_CHABU|nr:hypothetical protein CBR_g6643 [Chara braunii]|eukprot:GBG70515.1 hypothetical protein CBR_g6643 [Chara braunii]
MPPPKPCFAPSTSSTFLQPRSIFYPMETPDENAGLSCIVDWGYSESQYGTPRADHAQQSSALRGQAGFAPPPNASEHDVLGTQVPNSQFFGSRGHPSSVGTAVPGRGSPCRDVDATLPPPLSSPRTPVAGLSYGVTVRDENYLRQQLRMRAIAMAEGQSRDPFVVAGSRVPHLSPSHSEASRTVTPERPLAAGDCSDGPRRSLDGGSVTPPPRSSSAQGVRDSVTPPSGGGGHSRSSAQQSPGCDYIINRLVRDVEGGVFSTGGSAGFIYGGLGNPDVAIRADVSPQAPPSRDGNAHAVNDGAGAGGPSYVPATDVGGYGSSAGGRPQRGHVRPPDAPKNSDRWGEEETTVLCQTRNETKALLGEETEGMGRARAKAGFWKNVEHRMWESGYYRDHDQCKGKFSQVMDFYRRLKIHEGWSGLPSYWDMNQTKRKRYNVDFVLRRSWYDTINAVEKDVDSINLCNLWDSSVEQERWEEANKGAHGGGDTEGVSEDMGGGSEGGTPTSRPTPFEPTLGKRKRTASNARETSMKAVTGAMRDHTAAVTRSDRECAKLRCDTTRDIAVKQMEVHRETVDKDIAARERVATIGFDKMEKGYVYLADAIRSLREPRKSRTLDDSQGSGSE